MESLITVPIVQKINVGQDNFSRSCPLRHRVLIPSSFAPSILQIEIEICLAYTKPLSTIYCNVRCQAHGQVKLKENSDLAPEKACETSKPSSQLIRLMIKRIGSSCGHESRNEGRWMIMVNS